jgi:hypothetical protein
MKIIKARGKRWVVDKAVVVTILRVELHDGYRVHNDGKPAHSNWNSALSVTLPVQEKKHVLREHSRKPSGNMHSKSVRSNLIQVFSCHVVLPGVN